ncbi:hypothetical protein JOD31_000481 [Methylopila capsulata]|uniref:Uncharacterized protein n=1 Tax=Methylopila capsulata TaxID=61654 RepID=A0A9W6IS72_9HYPH|nr:hypothetical protein [Methylopila capsulata]MBM7850269.1 hypothetical protein [Methylopila capsulata]GLK55562.1 hypothetical protein GCM10008170_15810 [Methylopila capsulata]
MRDRSIGEILVVAILATIMVFVIADLAGGFGDFPNERWASAVALVCIAVWIGPGALARWRGNASGAVRAVALWLAIAVVIALAYVYGHGFLADMGVRV